MHYFLKFILGINLRKLCCKLVLLKESESIFNVNCLSCSIGLENLWSTSDNNIK